MPYHYEPPALTVPFLLAANGLVKKRGKGRSEGPIGGTSLATGEPPSVEGN
jgi:hypothetical protein